MKAIFYPAGERGHADFGWLNAHHSFSFGEWYNPEKVHFGALRVLNDDLIAGGAGFPTHPHDNMEIITIPLSGAIAHKDSTGGNGIINSGDVQIMSAGTGVRHSEYNASPTETLNLLQVWVIPKQENIQPRYDQKSYDAAERKNKWQVVVSPDEKDGGLWINQDAIFALTDLDAGTTLTYEKKFAGNGVYFFVIDGSVTIGDLQLDKKDALGISETDVITISATNHAKLLAIEIPMLG
ncbi:MAG: pirin family protein [Chitinophagaceae bacterium]